MDDIVKKALEVFEEKVSWVLKYILILKYML
jgi:hypothetical protein